MCSADPSKYRCCPFLVLLDKVNNKFLFNEYDYHILKPFFQRIISAGATKIRISLDSDLASGAHCRDLRRRFSFFATTRDTFFTWAEQKLESDQVMW